MPLPPEELGLPVLPDMAVEAAAAEPVEEMVEADTEELAAGAVEAQDDSDEEEDDEEEAEVEQQVEGAAATTPKRRADDEPASFLAMYFRDMAELDVLRPEQEFETARNIEQMELDLWRHVLGFAPGDGLDPRRRREGARTSRCPRRSCIVQRLNVRAASRRSRHAPGSRKPGPRSRPSCGCWTSIVCSSTRRWQRSSAWVAPPRACRTKGTIPFSTSTKAFADYVRVVGLKAFKLKAAKNEFVKANLRLVVSIARRFNHGRLPLADLIQEGNIGLMKAVERYDYRRGFRFSTYASWWIRHAISRALADKGRAVRLPVHMIDAYHRIAKSQRELQSKLERPPSTQEIAAATGIEADKLEKMKTFLSETPVSLDRPISDEDGRRLIDVLVDPNEGPAVPEQMASSETQNEMLKLLASLKPIEADILRKRFGLVNDRERTLKEIGDEYRLSRERVRQLQEQALGKMRRAMAKRESV